MVAHRPASWSDPRMQKPSPELVEASLPQSTEGGGLRRAGFLALLLVVAAGAWVRFSDRVTEWAPGLAAPVHAARSSDQVRGLLELGLVPAAASSAAIQAMQLPDQDAAALQQAVSRERLRLVRLPLFERDGGTGATVLVDANGLTRVVHLTARPVVLSIPVAQAGNVSFRLLDGSPPAGVGPRASPGLGIGAITLNGPVALPALAAGQTLEVGIVAQ